MSEKLRGFDNYVWNSVEINKNILCSDRVTRMLQETRSGHPRLNLALRLLSTDYTRTSKAEKHVQNPPSGVVCLLIKGDLIRDRPGYSTAPALASTFSLTHLARKYGARPA